MRTYTGARPHLHGKIRQGSFISAMFMLTASASVNGVQGLRDQGRSGKWRRNRAAPGLSGDPASPL